MICQASEWIIEWGEVTESPITTKKKSDLMGYTLSLLEGWLMFYTWKGHERNENTIKIPWTPSWKLRHVHFISKPWIWKAYEIVLILISGCAVLSACCVLVMKVNFMWFSSVCSSTLTCIINIVWSAGSCSTHKHGS